VLAGDVGVVEVAQAVENVVVDGDVVWSVVAVQEPGLLSVAPAWR
jgi:hypothetical protein